MWAEILAWETLFSLQAKIFFKKKNETKTHRQLWVLFISAEAQEKRTEDKARSLAKEPNFGPLSWGLQGGKYSLTKGGFVQTET